jgi:hypothetical protein
MFYEIIKIMLLLITLILTDKKIKEDVIIAMHRKKLFL